MFGLGMGELLVILAVALLVFGPKKLPELASGLGKAIRDFRKATRDLKDQIEIDDNVRQPFQELRSALRDEPPPRPMPRAAPAAADPLGEAPPETDSSKPARAPAPDPMAATVEVIAPKDPVR